MDSMFVDFVGCYGEKYGVILLNKSEISDGKHSKISNNCACFKSNRIMK